MELDHPCKQTCSGWKQGYEKGAAKLAAVEQERDSARNLAAARGQVNDAERDALRARIGKLRAALEFLSCEGMDDADFYAEENITEGTITMANRARSALAADDQDAKGMQ